jgi:phosphotransferase system enzyme I (PtsI)
MEIKQGIPASPGVAIGPAFVLDAERIRIPDKFIERGSYPDEIARLRAALEGAANAARQNEKVMTEKVGKEYGAIFGAHALMAEDPALRTEMEAMIRDHGFTAEYSVSKVMSKRVRVLESLNQPYFKDRTTDLHDLEQQILKLLQGGRQEPLHHLRAPVVLLAHDLTPSEVANLDHRFILGFATEAGGKTSHTAIMAGVFGIPAIVGLGRFLTEVSGGDKVIIDGTKGVIVIDPDEETLNRFELAQRDFTSTERELAALRDLPAVTKDGTLIHLYGNIEFPEEVRKCFEKGCVGVGLYRTEFLYLGKVSDPTEDEHYAAYRQVVSMLGKHRSVTVRTLDVGADKFSSVSNQDAERNPFLGVRSLRICLRNLQLFKTQLRAILRASAEGDVRIMFPMVSTVHELRQSKMILGDVMDDLEEQGIPFNRRLAIGTMIEVPSAALIADILAKEVNFFSIGTNDLIQYTMAADRTNENVAELYNAGDPSVLRLIDRIVSAAGQSRNPVEVCVCGEMSGDPLYTMLLVGLGIRSLSATPHHIPEVKRLIRSITLDDAIKVARGALALETARDVNNYLRDQMRRVLPDRSD